MKDGEVLKLAGLEITMHATPGHTPGGASWTWRACEGGTCANIAYVDSLTLVSAPGYRFTDHADVVAQFRRSAAVIEQLPCDLLVSAHPDFSGLLERHARGALVDPDACRGYAQQGRRFITERLASERN
jgi:metallo-beta-lactamase class B